MASVVRMPITNVPMGGAYTGVITVAPGGTPLVVLLDTGSSTIVVDGHAFDPQAAGARTTNLAQTVTYGAGSWVGAVVQTSIALSAEVALAETQLAVTYSESPNIFGGAQGILGLAYAPLDAAYAMPADSWASRYTAEQLATGSFLDIAPYFTQLEEAGVVANKLAFSIQRAAVSAATDDPATDPQNTGLLVLGAGEELTDLYTGAFTDVEVVDDVWYDVDLVGVQVGTQPVIPVPAPPAGARVSSAFVDSGTSCLMFAQPLYEAILDAFRGLDPAFAATLAAGAPGADGVDQTTLELSRWPDLHLVLGATTLAVPPTSYWQLDAAGRGRAVAYLVGDQGSLGGRSILGLPLFCGRYTVFDRSMDGGRGVIRFATRV